MVIDNRYFKVGRILPAFLLFVMITLTAGSCDLLQDLFSAEPEAAAEDVTPPDPVADLTPSTGDGTVFRSQSYGQPFDESLYGGMIAPESGAGILTGESDLIFTDPVYDAITADGYFDIAGTIDTGTDYYLFTLYKDRIGDPLTYTPGPSVESTSYWVGSGDFKKRIYLRFGEGEYTLVFHRIVDFTASEYGVIFSWSYLVMPTVIRITNLNPEDGRYLYPSDFIQTVDPEIAALADDFNYSSTENLIRNIHDWVVKYLYYDFDSTIIDDDPDSPTYKLSKWRKKQDAVSTLHNGSAVCEGYASLYAALLRAFSIPVVYVTGGGHAWNRFWDGTDWYFSDPAWDDPVMEVNGEPPTSNFPDGFNLQVEYFMSQSLWEDHVLETAAGARSFQPEPAIPGYPGGTY